MATSFDAKAFFTKAVDDFLLRSVEARAAKRTVETQSTIARACTAASARISVADPISEESSLPAAIALYREALTFFAVAILEDAGEHVQSSVEAWQKFGEWKSKHPELELPDDFLRAQETLFSGELLRVDALPVEEQATLRQTVQLSCGVMQAYIDPRTPVDVRIARWRRIGIVLAVLTFFVWMGIRAMSRPQNFARNAFVTSSSQFPGTPPPSAVVNGDIEGKFGVHTQIQDGAWVLLDLGEVHSMKEIRIYNRGDEYAREVPPLVLETSLDGKQYDVVDRRDTLFGQADPWVIRKPQKARYVRVSKPGRGYIALAEIEIY